MLRCLKSDEARHASESDAVVDDPEQLLIGVALHSLTREVGGTRVHPLSGWRVGSAVDAVAYTAIQTVACKSHFNAGPRVDRRRGNSAATS